MAKNIIIGGGIAGLCTAFHLVKSGEKVTIIEAETVGEKTTNKAAGMITPASEVHLGEDTLMSCFVKSSAYYESFVKDLTDNQPNVIDFNRTGSLMCAIDQDGLKDLNRLVDFQKGMGFSLEELSRQQVLEREPFLTHKVVRALYSKNEAYVDNRKLAWHLKKILIDQGVEILEHKRVTHLHFQNDIIQKITVGDKEAFELTADRFILTTGLEELDDLKPIHRLPLRPVKGQIVTIQAEPGSIRCPIRIYHRYPIYLVPRNDGRIVIGATAEELTDETVTAGGVMDLIYAAWQALPLVFDHPLIETNVGMRPAAPDHKPILGKTKLKNLYLFTGLYRHGILISPYLSKELVNLMQNKENELDWNEFSIERFEQEQEND